MSEEQGGRVGAAPARAPEEVAGQGPLHPVTGGPPEQAELTVRALVSGGLVGSLLALTNVYAGLKTGFWESGCLFSALLAFSGMSAFGAWRKRPHSPLETNLAQTAAVSVGAVPASAGLLGAIPALALLGAEAPALAVALWGVGLGTLGVLFAFALRRRLLEEEALPFPTGAATAELITTLHASGTSHAVRTRALGLSSLGTMLLAWLRDARGVVPAMTAFPGQVRGLPAEALLLGVAWNPMLLGIGLLVGPRAGLSLLVGSLLAWVGLAPWLVREGLVAGAEFGPLSDWLLWPGMGLMVGAAAMSLVSQVRALPDVVRDVRGLGRRGTGWEASAGRWLVRAVPLLILLTLLTGLVAFELSPLHFLLALVLAFPLCAVCARATGQTDIAPISPVGQLSQVALGSVAPGAPALNVVAGSVVAGAASHTSNSLWSLQAGRLLGASASRQLLVQLAGVLLGTAVAIPAYHLLVRVHGLGTEALPVPSAGLFKAVAELSSRGLEGLPPSSLRVTGLAFLAGLVLSAAARGRLERWLPSAAAMGLGFLLPASYAVSLCLGSVLAGVVGRFRASATQPTQAAAAGAIVGESLMGIALAALLALGLMQRPG